MEGTTTTNSVSATADEPWRLVESLFPFAFRVDGRGVLAAVAPRLGALSGARVGDALSAHFVQESPARPFDVIEARTRSAMLVTMVTARDLRLRGQFVPYADGVLFVGGPRVRSIEDVETHGLKLSDFPPHDPRLDLLVLVSTKETALEDARRLTAELQRAKADIETRAEELSRELVSREAASSLGRLVAGVAHEVNTPLGVSVTALSVLSESVEAIEAMLRSGTVRRTALVEAVGSVRTASDLISTNVQRAAALVKNFKQVAVDQNVRQPRQLELGSYVEQVLASLTPLTRGTRVGVRVVKRGATPCTVDPGSISQLVTILLENAVLHAFGPEGGTVTFEVEPQGDHRVLSCSDDGVGMTPEVLRSATAPFFTTRRSEGGTGLGLFILRRLVDEVLRAQLEIRTAPGRGSTFRIVLPATS